MRTVLSFLLLAGAVSAAPLDYSRDVRPILSQHCFQCHGPDEAALKGKLRLDQANSAHGAGQSGDRAIVPGKPDESEVVRRIFAKDADEIMPPPATKKPLSEQQKQVLKRWIAEGATYREHWSLLPPQRVAIPAGAHPIDHFVNEKLKSLGLSPSAPAAPEKLVRRLYLDLIGLPPTVEQLEAFRKDTSPQAYEKLVDQLLASPHYGERWARKWLDLARYADTNGFEKDRVRTMWPYRDWVIQALNNDLPFDRFTIEQLAGDLLPNATIAQRVATGFHRNTMLNEEGGNDPLEYRWHAMNDRVATTGTVWLGLTLNCCQCHNHKYDPISQREYYQIFAFLNNCNEPLMDVPDPAIQKQRLEREAQIAEREAKLAEKFPADPKNKLDAAAHLQARFEAWQKDERARAIAWTILEPLTAQGNLPLLTHEGQGVVFVSGDKSKRDVYDLKYRSEKPVRALRLEVLPDDRLPSRGPGRVDYEGPFGDFFLCEITVKAGGKAIAATSASASFANGGNTAANAIDGNILTGWSISGSQGKAQQLIINLAQPVQGEFDLQMIFEKYYAAGLGKFRVAVTDSDRKAEARGLSVEAERELLAAQPQRELLMREFLNVCPELKSERDAIQKERNALPKHPTTLVLEERGKNYVRPTFLHLRGEWLTPGPEVQAGVPGVLPALAPGSEPNRLRFARWLVDRRNPLTARVVVNRTWAAFFGRGIVRTTEDFGLQGEAPSHPELLDFLAVDFMERGWSMKQLHKQIVMSSTYQQSSRVTPDLLDKDPKNEWLSRGPRFRLEAEMIRDTVLKISGQLTSKIGGPSVFPPQPAGVSSEGAYGPLAWKVSQGEDRYRRGLYTFAKRTAPYAMFQTFDGPSGEACVARREISNTPLQALTLMNDQVFVEAAGTLGKELAASPLPDDERLKVLWRRCTARLPNEDELQSLRKFLQQQRELAVQRQTSKLPKEGHGDALAIERRVWEVTARAILNLDETLTKE